MYFLWRGRGDSHPTLDTILAPLGRMVHSRYGLNDRDWHPRWGVSFSFQFKVHLKIRRTGGNLLGPGQAGAKHTPHRQGDAIQGLHVLSANDLTVRRCDITRSLDSSIRKWKIPWFPCSCPMWLTPRIELAKPNTHGFRSR